MSHTLTRRELFQLRHRAPDGLARITDTGLAPYQGPWGGHEVRHLLRRTLFGVKREEVTAFEGLTPEQAVETLLVTGAPPSPPVNNYHDAAVQDPAVPPGETWVDAAFNADVEYARYVSLKGWWIGLMTHQAATIEEKMIIFWHNQLATQAGGVFNARMWYRHLGILRTHCLGNFKTLVREITLDPLMLIYLNGAFSEKGAPDENYARELQELFCIGKGPGSQYTEDDVQAAARVLTGWRVDWDLMTSFFEPYFHDTEDKQFSGFYNNTLITGRTGPDGAQELDDLLDMIFANPETALFLCRKLYRFFVYRTITEQAERDVIVPLAEIFRANNYEIRPVLAALLKSEHFYDLNHRNAMIKSPLDFVIGLSREYALPFPDATQLRDSYTLRMYFWYVLNVLQQDPGDPPNVAGWPAWHQDPQFDRFWITTATLPKRAEFIEAMINYGYSTDTFRIIMDTIAHTAGFPAPEDPEALIDAALAHMTEVTPAPQVRQNLKRILLSNQLSDYYWTDAWLAYTFDPANEMKRFTVESRLKAFYKSLIQLEENQLM
ncbi:MAG: DUF1800 domain-containing protein [Bacteroidia bacterium]|nr:DUF1800 domain-containing protein [Bacteroidia bacterium]